MATPFTVKTAEDFKTTEEAYSYSYIVATANVYETIVEKNEQGILQSAYVAGGGGSKHFKITIDNVEIKEYVQFSNTCQGMINFSDMHYSVNWYTKSSNFLVQVLPTATQLDKHFAPIKFNNLKIEVKASNTSSFFSYYNIRTD
jgi:hypothetical protein